MADENRGEALNEMNPRVLIVLFSANYYQSICIIKRQQICIYLFIYLFIYYFATLFDFLSLKNDVNVPSNLISRKKLC
jgi:hypothetical protein